MSAGLLRVLCVCVCVEGEEVRVIEVLILLVVVGKLTHRAVHHCQWLRP